MYLSFSYLSHTSTDFDENSHDVLHFYMCTYKKIQNFLHCKNPFLWSSKNGHNMPVLQSYKKGETTEASAPFIFL